MKTFPAEFATELAKKTGITPVWILRLNIGGTLYDLSDSVFVFPGGMADGFTQTLDWIDSWGEVRESISGTIGEMLVSDFGVSVAVDQDASPNIRDLALGSALEQNPATLYLWLEGLPASVPPQAVFVGYIKDIDVPDETVVHLGIEDESTRFQKYIGTRISSEEFPLCDPDDVGKLIPIVYGTVEKLPTRCVDSGWATTLMGDITELATEITVSELPVDSVVYKTITIDDEQMQILSVVGKTLTVLRAQGGTISLPHTSGSLVLERKATPLVYLLADHPLDSIGLIYARVKGFDVDITADCTTYLGTPANQLIGYEGRAALAIPDFARLSQRIALELFDGIRLNDTGHTHATGTTTTSGTHNASPLPTSFPTIVISPTQIWPHSSMLFYCGEITFPDVGPIYECSFSITFENVMDRQWVVMGGKFDTTFGRNQTEIYGHTTLPTSNHVTLNLDATQMKYNVITIYRWVRNNSDYPMNIGPNVSPLRVVACSRTYKAYVSGVGTTSAGAMVTKTGTVSLSGNSVADITLGDMILANVTRNISTPFAVLDDFLSTYCNDTGLVQVGTFPDTYSLNGAITEYKKAIEWLDYLSFQCRAFFRKIGGVSRLIVRDVNPAVTGTIPACCLTDEGIKALGYKKAPITDVINAVKVLFNRDWSSSGRQSESYRNTVASSDSASIAIYGEQEQPEMFMFDFVTDETMANSLATFYQDFYGDRKWRVTFSTFLDNARFEFGDIVALPFANDLVGVVVEAGIAPANTGQMDRMYFVVEAAIIPLLDANALTTLLGDQFMTKNRERIVYV